MKTWIAVVNRSEARFFEADSRKGKQLTLVKKLENPRGRLRDGDINADRPGASRGSFLFSSTRLVKMQSPTERIAQIFAKTVAQEIEAADNEHLFEDLILVVEPNFLGKLRLALSKKVMNKVSETLRKDLVNVPDHQMPQFVWPKKKQPREEFSLNP